MPNFQGTSKSLHGGNRDGVATCGDAAREPSVGDTSAAIGGFGSLFAEAARDQALEGRHPVDRQVGEPR
jgi:hypothetical protein